MRGQLIQKSKQLNLIKPNYSIKGHIILKSQCGIPAGLHTADDNIKLFKKSNSHLRNFSTNNKQVPIGNLRPWQVTGLTDSEGAFTISISGKSVKLEFKVTQKEHSAVILNHLQKYFDCGSVVVDNRSTGTLKLRVSKLSDILDKIITHFENFPCLTSKALNFQDWKKVALLMKDSQHLNPQGLEQIKTILKNMNKNRTFEDKYNYCVTKIGLQPNGDVKIELPSDWVHSFIDGEGTFYNYLASKPIRGKPYQRCDSSLEIAQNSHDVAILLAIKKQFGGGYIKPKYNFCDINECKNSRSVNRFIFRDTDTIIKFVDNHPLLTRKQLDYLDWKKIVELKESGAHKTVEGLELIKHIISNMNSTRNVTNEE